MHSTDKSFWVQHFYAKFEFVMWKTCQVKCGGLCRIALDAEPCLPVCMDCGAVQVEASLREAGWVFLLASHACFWHWAGCGVESLMVLSFACPAARNSAKVARGRPRMAMTGRRGRRLSGSTLFAQIPPQRGGDEFSGCTWPIPGARTQSGPRIKGTKSSASMVHGWIFGCLRASEKSLYRRHGPNMSLRGTGTVLPMVHLDLNSWEIADGFARICSQARRFRVLPRGSGTRWHGHTARFSRRNGWRSSWTTSRTG